MLCAAVFNHIVMLRIFLFTCNSPCSIDISLYIMLQKKKKSQKSSPSQLNAYPIIALQSWLITLYIITVEKNLPIKTLMTAMWKAITITLLLTLKIKVSLN